MHTQWKISYQDFNSHAKEANDYPE